MVKIDMEVVVVEEETEVEEEEVVRAGVRL